MMARVVVMVRLETDYGSGVKPLEIRRGAPVQGVRIFH